MSDIIANLTKIALLQQQTAVLMTVHYYKVYQDFIAYNMPYTNICSTGKKK